MLPVGRDALVRPNDQLFVFDESHAYHPEKVLPKWVEIAAAYKDAADQLVGQLKQQSRIKISALYPLVFLYRHFLEMEIKSLLLLSYIGMEKREVGLNISSVLHTHDPKRLSEELANSPTLADALQRQIHFLGDEFMGSRQCWGILDSLFEILDEVSALDSGSYTFRYSVTKALSPATPNLHGLSLSNLEAVSGRVEATFRWLRAILERHIDETVNRDLSDSEIFGS